MSRSFGLPRGWRAVVGCAVVAVAIVLAGCATEPQAPQVPPSAPVWVVGDSLATGTGFSVFDPRPYVWGVGAAGFTSGANSTILGNTTQQLTTNSARPLTMLVVGGVNDLAINATIAQITTQMAAFEAAMTKRGITVVWVKEPGWSRADQMLPIYQWQETRAHWIDCLYAKGPNMPGDGDHPFSYTDFGACVGNKLRVMPGIRLS